MTGDTRERTECLVDLIMCFTAGQQGLVVPRIKEAYRRGCAPEDLLAAIDMARRLGDVPAPLLRQAWQAVRDWGWIWARQMPGAVPAAGERGGSGNS